LEYQQIYQAPGFFDGTLKKVLLSGEMAYFLMLLAAIRRLTTALPHDHASYLTYGHKLYRPSHHKKKVILLKIIRMLVATAPKE